LIPTIGYWILNTEILDDSITSKKYIMKTIRLKILAFIFLSTIFFSCKESSSTNDNTIHGSGRIVTHERTVDECNGILIKSVGNVYLTQGTSQSIRIEADDNIIEKVVTRKENGILVTGLESGSYSNITLKIYVSLKTINQLSIEGAGNIAVENPIEGDSIVASIIGAGNISLKGSDNFLNCRIDGAGNINAENFIAKKCTALVNGAGNCTVYVTEDLNATVIGVGTINYYGNPQRVTASVQGLGQIIKK